MVFPKQVLNKLSGGVRISGLTTPSICLFLYEYLNSISNAILVELPSEDEAFALYSLCLDSELGCFVYFPTEAPLERVPGFGTDTLRFRKEAIIELSSGRPTCCIGTKSSFIDKCLESGLSKEEYKYSGGCYAPRRISRFDAGGAISRHAWGIAIDINTITGYSPRIVEIFNSWGFAWGGTWTSPDEMLFELRRLSASISKNNS